LAERVSDQVVFVQILSEQGTTRFSVEFRAGDTEGVNLHWQTYEKVARDAAGQEVTAGDIAVPLEALPELDKSATMAAYVQKQVIESLAGQEHDNWGCDLPFTWVTSCGGLGSCCDIHDACYAQFHCSSSSWWNPFASTACKACNAGVVACIAQPIKGPSICCFLGNCGQPR